MSAAGCTGSVITVPRESLVTVEFGDLGSRTEVILVHANFDGPGPLEPYQTGWESGLDKLRAHVEPHRPKGGEPVAPSKQ